MGTGQWFMIKSFGKPCLSSDPWRKWRLQILAQIFRRAGDYWSVMQAVCDWAQIKPPDSKGLGELPSWQYCQLPHHDWKEETPSMTPRGENAQKHHTWTSPRPCPCVSTFFWFCFVSFCSNKTVTIGTALSWGLWVIPVNYWNWGVGGNPGTCSWCLVEDCAFHVWSLAWLGVVSVTSQSSSLFHHLLY